MKKLLYIFTIILNYSFFSAIVTECADKIALVNISTIFQQSPQRVIAAQQLENEFKIRATELQSLEQDLQNKIHILQKDGPLMKESERNSLEKLVIAQREKFSNKAQEFERDNHRRQTEERDKILNNIHEIVKLISIKKGYNLVIDSGAIAYSNNITDITDDVLKQVK